MRSWSDMNVADQPSERHRAAPALRAFVAVSAATIAHLSLRPTGYDPGWSATFAGWPASAVAGAAWAFALATGGRPAELIAMMKLLGHSTNSRWHGWPTVVLRVVTEEAIWRGTAMVFLTAAFNYVIGIVLAGIGFGLMHSHQGARGVLVNTTTGIMLGLCTYFLGGLIAAILAHLTYNLVVLGMLVGARRRHLVEAGDDDQHRE